MINCKKILKHHVLLICIFFFFFVVYGLYVLGIIKSFRITFVSTSVLGYLTLLLFYAMQVFVTYIGSRLGKTKSIEIECIKPQRVLILAYVYMLISFSGLMRLTINLVGNYGIKTLISMILRNRHLDLLVQGSGNTILCVFSQVSLIMIAVIFDKKKKFHIFSLVLNLGLLVIYASFLSSRILIIEGIVFVTIILLRRFLYEYSLKMWKFIGVFFLVSLLLIITSGYRDFEQSGTYYTDSEIKWGISRIADYVISTMNTQLDIVEYMEDKESTFPVGTLEVLSLVGLENPVKSSNLAWRQKISAAEYTNIGPVSQIYSDYKMGYIVFVFLLAIIYSICWRMFDKGKLVGYYIYPIVVYNILESWRTYLFGTLMAEVLLLLSLFSYFLCKGAFKKY